jgi:putative transposase
MPNYRRAFVPGGCYFFTVNLLDRNSRLLIEHIDSLRDAVRKTKQRFPFEIDAMVILPDHIHAVWTLPEGDADFPVRWRWIKIRFSRSIPRGERLDAARIARGERGIWQRRYWEHVIRDERDEPAIVDVVVQFPAAFSAASPRLSGRRWGAWRIAGRSPFRGNGYEAGGSALGESVDPVRSDDATAATYPSLSIWFWVEYAVCIQCSHRRPHTTGTLHRAHRPGGAQPSGRKSRPNRNCSTKPPAQP